MKLPKLPKPLKKVLRQKARLEMVATDLRTRTSIPSENRDYSMTVSTPANSTLISAEASLAELREIKVVWAALAANVGYLESCWDVVRWLGVPVFCHGHNNVQLWRSADGELAILGSENQKEFSPDDGAWRVERRMSAWLKDTVETACNQELLRRTSSPVDAVIFSSRCVVRHTWDYLDVKASRSACAGRDAVHSRSVDHQNAGGHRGCKARDDARSFRYRRIRANRAPG
jgi:hypothetical protein